MEPPWTAAVYLMVAGGETLPLCPASVTSWKHLITHRKVQGAGREGPLGTPPELFLVSYES